VIQISANSFTSYPTPNIRVIPAVPTDMQTPILQILGGFFFPGSQVLVNGSPRTTTYGSEVEISAALTAADVAQGGELIVTVTNPAPGGGSSNSYPVAVYVPIRNFTFRHTLYDAHSGHLFSSVDPISATDPGQVVVTDPATAKVLSAWTVGGGPNQLAISDDGTLLYVGLDGDAKVAQVATATGKVNFAGGIGLDLDFHNPMVADALQVLPGHAHSWAVTQCGVGFTSCGNGIAIFDDSVERASAVTQNELQADALLFIGSSGATLYGTTLNETPSTFYEFAIGTSGIALSQAITNFLGASPGGGPLDTDGTSIYVGNGQVINPATLAVSSTSFPVAFSPAALKVDTAASRIYFAEFPAQDNFFINYEIAAFGLANQAALGSIQFTEQQQAESLHRWGANGLALASQNAILLLQTSLTNNSLPASQFYVTGVNPANVASGSPDTTIVISGNGITATDTITANGAPLKSSGATAAQISAIVPAGLLAIGGSVQIAVTDTGGNVRYLVLTVNGAAPSNVVLSTSVLNFPSQILGSTTTQNVTLSNNGGTALTVSAITASGDFSQTNNCSSVAAGANCTIAVTFAPTATGSRAGSLQITENDVTKMQIVALNGIGGDVQIAATGAGGTSATVTSGQSASYSLAITPQGGVTGSLTFNCTGLPLHAACTFSPPSATLGAAPVTVSVTIATSQPSASLFPQNFPSRAAVVTLASLLLLPLGLRRKRMPGFARTRCALCLILALALLPIAGCGGGGSSTQPPPPPTTLTTPPGSYTVNFVITMGQVSRTTPLTLTVK
jgi:hypothetical protein